MRKTPHVLQEQGGGGEKEGICTEKFEERGEPRLRGPDRSDHQVCDLVEADLVE